MFIYQFQRVAIMLAVLLEIGILSSNILSRNGILMLYVRSFFLKKEREMTQQRQRNSCFSKLLAVKEGNIFSKVVYCYVV